MGNSLFIFTYNSQVKYTIYIIGIFIPTIYYTARLPDVRMVQWLTACHVIFYKTLTNIILYIMIKSVISNK